MNATSAFAAMAILTRDLDQALQQLTVVQQRSNELLEEARAARRLLAEMGELPAIWAKLDGLDRHILLGAARRLGRK